jgi:hypothetical protein
MADRRLVVNQIHTQAQKELQATSSGALLTTDGDTSVVIIDTDDDPIIYIGKAAIGSSINDPVWQIQRLDTSSGLIKTWADDARFTQVWDNRTSLEYN